MNSPKPTFADAVGQALDHHRAGRFTEAEACYRNMLEAFSDRADLHSNLGVALFEQGKNDEAIAEYRRAIEINPDHAEAHNNLGSSLAARDQFSEAVEAYRKVIALRPAFTQAYVNLARTLHRQRKLGEAVAAYLAAAHLDPASAEVLNNIGVLWNEIGMPRLAEAALNRAIQLRPGVGETHANLANALKAMGQFTSAITEQKRAAQLKPESAEIESNLAATLHDAGQFYGALAHHRRALVLDPSSATSHWNYAQTLLMLGNFADGWREYQYRWKVPTLSPMPALHGQLWNGQDLQNKTILLFAEQGMGDTIQFVRYAPVLAGRGARVIVRCQRPLVRLLHRLKAIEIVSDADETQRADFHCPLLDLPGIVNTDIHSIPAAIPYISADSELVSAWQNRLGHKNSPKRIGLAWGGRAQHSNDQHRSIPLRDLSPLLAIENCEFISLQNAHAVPEGYPMRDFSAELTDFAQTAGLVENLDLIISVDTAVAHLAGAMGKPVWLLLGAASDWRWMRNRSDSPWYPTMRIFRPNQPAYWTKLIRRVSEALQLL